MKNLNTRLLTLSLLFCYLVAPAHGQTCDLCPVDHYCIGLEKDPCPSNSHANAGSSVIEACVCAAGYFGVNGAVCETCNPDSYCIGGNVVSSCSQNSVSPSGSDAAVDCICAAGYYGDPGGVCTQCEVGSWCSLGVMNTCPDHTTSLLGSDELIDCKCLAGYRGSVDGSACTACPAGQWKSSIGIGSCTLCGGNTYSTTIAATSSGTCSICPANTFSGTGSTELTYCKCNAGHNAIEDGFACTPCVAGTYKSSTGVGICEECRTDTFSTAVAATDEGTCTNCPTNTFSALGSSELINCRCEAGYTAVANGVACTACIAGTYKTNTGIGVCDKCGVDTYSITVAATTEGTCTNCPSNTFSTQSSDQLADCSCFEGHSGVSDGIACTACVAGSYKVEYGIGECTSCVVDTYSTTVAALGPEVCLSCPENTISLSMSNERTDCICKESWQGELGGPCDFCQIGEWCSGGSRYFCSEFATSLAGSDEITDCNCIPGYYGPHGGQCQPCTADDYCPGGELSHDCPEHSSSPTGSAFVTDCACIGGYEGPNGGGCDRCPVDTYCESGGLSSCPTHSVSPAGSDQLTDCSCIPGYFGENGAECIKCTPNFFCPNGNSIISCPLNSVSFTGSNSSIDCTCKPGWHGAQGGECTECEAGTWCHAGVQTICPVFSNSPPVSTHIHNCTCLAGYVGFDGSACTACEAGTYKPTTGVGECTSCGPNLFSGVKGASLSTTCTVCPDKTFSESKSVLITDCTCIAGYSGMDGAECIACEAGTYKEQTGNHPCLDCGSNTYSTTIAATSVDTCDSCILHSNSGFGSNTQDDCSCNGGYFYNVSPSL